MSRNSGDFVSACEVYWGEWLPYEDCSLLESSTPETILMEKETIDDLPKECRQLANIILNLPEEMYLVNGKLKRTFLRKFVKAKTGWSLCKVEKVQSKLENILLEK